MEHAPRRSAQGIPCTAAYTPAPTRSHRSRQDPGRGAVLMGSCAICTRRGRPFPAISGGDVGSIVGIRAAFGAARRPRKWPGAGKLLEAAGGVEPAMEILQSSVGGAGQWPTMRDCAAQSRFPAPLHDARCAAMTRRDDASCRQSVGKTITSWALARTRAMRANRWSDRAAFDGGLPQMAFLAEHGKWP